MIINPYMFGVANTGNGYLYNWYAASNANFAPTDWKVPTQSEWETLATYLGGESVAGGKLKEAGTTHWSSPNTGADNSSGFTSLPNGERGISGLFDGINYFSLMWGLTELTIDDSFGVNTDYNYADLILTDFPKYYGCAIRLLYTGAGTPSTVTDYDGNVYDTVVIGTQRWTVQNWKCTKLNNGTSIPNQTDGTTWAGLTTLARCAYDNNESYV